MSRSGPRLAGLAPIVLALLIALVGAGCAGEATSSAPAPTSTPTRTVTALPPTVVGTAVPLPTSLPTSPATPRPTMVGLRSSPTPTVVPRAASLAVSSIVDTECPPDVAADGVVCKRAILPEDDQHPGNGRTVKLLLAIVDSGDPLEIGPVVYLQGGPGAGGAEVAKYFVNQSLHLIFVDQRGTGFSSPSLDCPETDDDYPNAMALGQTVAATDRYLAGEQACADRLRDAGVDLSQFTTEQNADDIALLRELLGFPTWTLWGSSYGTRLGLAIMRDHPTGVRAAVLDSVLPHQVDFFAGIPTTARRALDVVIDDCVASVPCADRYGDLDGLIDSTAQLLDADPVVVTATRPVSGDALPVLVDGAMFMSFLFDQLYVMGSIPLLPSMIERASNRDLEDLVQRVVDRNDPESFVFSEGLYFTTWCSDEVPFTDPDADEVVLADETSAFRRAHEYDLAEHCDRWAVESADVLEDEAVVSDIPTLLFAGRFDPITPPDYAELAAATLANSKVVVMPNHGHGMFTPCPTGLMTVFLQQPDRVAELDTECSETVPPITWD